MGKLYVVGTPIGNLDDITKRAINTLQDSDFIVCEDKRRTSILLNTYHIKKPLIVYHDHNKKKITPKILSLLNDGNTVALVSDAGTPGICDPGFYLIRAAIQIGIEIIPIPGASALITAIVVSGLPTDRFVFEGYFNRRKGKRKKRLQQLRDEPRTMVFYEAPTRIIKTLNDIKEILGDRKVVITRELTKKFEEIIRGRISDILENLKDRKMKGEFTVVLEGKREK